MANTAYAFTFWQLDLKLVFVSLVGLCFPVDLLPTFHAVVVKIISNVAQVRTT
jgi:hypothetical protein